METYYIENVERGTVGNSVQWWKWNNNGYTCDIRAARIFNEKDALELVKDRKKYKMHRTNYINSLVQYHVDMQDLNHASLIPHTLVGMTEYENGQWKI